MLFHPFRPSKAGFVAVLAAILLLSARPAVAEEVTLDHGGVTLKGTMQLAEGKTMADGVLLILHGTLAHKDMEIVTMLRDLMAEREVSTLSVSLSLGQSNREGMYDCAVPHRHRHEDAVDEVAAWVDWLKARGAGDIWVAGHSRGGNQIAWYAAERLDPAVVSRVALIAPAISTYESGATSYKRAKKTDLEPVLDKAKALVAAGKGDELMKGVGLLYCPDSDVTAASFVSYYKDEPRRNTINLVDKIKVPLLIIAGSEDTVVRGLDKAIGSKADGKNLRFVNVEGAGHFFRDLYGEDVADAIAEHIDG